MTNPLLRPGNDGDDGGAEPVVQPEEYKKFLKEQQEGFKKEKEEAVHSTVEELNLVFMVQAFLFGAEAVIAQAVQSTDSFEVVLIAVQALYFGLPTLGLWLSFLSFCLIYPLFQREVYLNREILLHSPDGDSEIRRLERMRYDANERKNLRKHRIYFAILFFVFVLWTAVLGCSIADALGMSPGSSPSLRGSAAPSVSPSISSPTP